MADELLINSAQVRLCSDQRRPGSAFSFPEVLVSVFIVGIVVIALYSAFTQGVFMTQMARENQRATQILLEKSEQLRLCGWAQIISNGWVPPTFSVPYDPLSSNSGAVFSGTISIANAPMAGAYSNNLKEVRIRLTWKTGSLSRDRELKTFIARYGLHTYVY